MNGAAAVVLVPIALVAFRDSFSLARMAGIVLTLGALSLLAR